MLKIVTLLCIALVPNFHLTNGFFKPPAVFVEEYLGDEDVLQPLLLTPLIEQKKIKEALNASKVILEGAEDIKSYSGFLTVDKSCNSNLFFWFFLSKDQPDNDPVLLWLQGGPGSPSLFGLFTEHGPFLVTDDLELQLRNVSWVNKHSVLYIDNPVGTGFSFTTNGYASEETQIGKQLYIALVQFFQLFPHLQTNDFYVTGESYAGKYVPALGYTIMINNPSASTTINLKGLAIGNGFTDPIHQLIYGDYLYQHGLIDAHQRNIYKETEKLAHQYLKAGSYTEASDLYGLIDEYFSTFTGLTNIYNYVDDGKTINNMEKNFRRYIQIPKIRRALHVGNTKFGARLVSIRLQLDEVNSVAHWVGELLSNYRMLIYTGQLDVIVNYMTVVNYLEHLDFSSKEEYKIAPRLKWYVGDKLAGYAKVAGNLTELLVRNAGHMVPSDQPEWALDMITRFTRKQNFF